MNDLLARAIAAHGGLERWNTFNKVTATTIGGGGLRPMKGLEADTTPRERTVTLHEETTCISPFGQPNGRMAFTPDRVAAAEIAQAAFDFGKQRVRRLERDPRRELAGPGGEWLEHPGREAGKVQRDPKHGTVFSRAGKAAPPGARRGA